MQAETEASTLKTWASVFTSYQHYKQCDDGAIAEGYSDSIADLLAAHWDQVGELNKLAIAHPEFEGFVIRHLDDLMTPVQSTVIRTQAKSSCPASASKLCEAIEKQFSDLERMR
ncbi:hypothetical protein IGX34_15555 [Dyella sp. 7MK23]|uniref:Uncharacterized protein n=1 Tax=Dyella acidiphila TaxID=2775866 RepID=A0ABR9GCP5_9GAMM|nr:hypothetical protein [Dyella acidiphila]